MSETLMVSQIHPELALNAAAVLQTLRAQPDLFVRFKPTFQIIVQQNQLQ